MIHYTLFHTPFAAACIPPSVHHISPTSYSVALGYAINPVLVNQDGLLPSQHTVAFSPQENTSSSAKG